MIDLSQKQSDAWHYLEDKETNEILYGGGAGGGKSYLGCLWHIYRRNKYPGTRGLIGRKDLKSIKESTLVTYLKVCNLLGYRPGTHYKYNAMDSVINWNNGSRTILKDLDYIPSDPSFERLGSTEYTDAFIDEAGEITLKAFEIVNSRIRWMLHDYDLEPKILLTCNPNNNWIKYKYIKDEKNNEVELKAYQKYVRALVSDNPDKDFASLYQQQLEKLTSDFDKQRLLDGDWDLVPQEGVLFPLNELNFYNPEKTNVEKLAEYKFVVIDPADTGGDDLSAPFGYLIGDKIYIASVIYNTDGTDVNEPKCVDEIVRRKINSVVIEGNSAWLLFGKSVRSKVNELYPDCEIRIIKNSTNKHTRILAQSAFIKRNFVFRNDWRSEHEYSKFLLNLTSYQKIQEGALKNKHDDSADSLAEMGKYFSTNFPHLW